jgi:hypothetical protein
MPDPNVILSGAKNLSQWNSSHHESLPSEKSSKRVHFYSKRQPNRKAPVYGSEVFFCTSERNPA